MGGRGISAAIDQRAAGYRGDAGQGRACHEVQRARTGLGQVERAAADGTAHAEGVAIDGDRAVGAERDGTVAEVEVIGAGETEVSVPGLRVVGFQGHRGSAGIAQRTAGDDQGAAAEGGHRIDVHPACVEREGTGEGVGAGEGEGAIAGLRESDAVAAQVGGDDGVAARIAGGVGSAGEVAAADGLAAASGRREGDGADGLGGAAEVELAASEAERGGGGAEDLVDAQDAAVDGRAACVSVVTPKGHLARAGLGEGGIAAAEIGPDHGVTGGVADRIRRCDERAEVDCVPGGGRLGNGDSAEGLLSEPWVELSAREDEGGGKAERGIRAQGDLPGVDYGGARVTVQEQDDQFAASVLGQSRRAGDVADIALGKRLERIREGVVKGDSRRGHACPQLHDPVRRRVVEEHGVSLDVVRESVGGEFPVSRSAGRADFPFRAVRAGPLGDLGVDDERDLADNVRLEGGDRAGGRAGDEAFLEAGHADAAGGRVIEQVIGAGRPAALSDTVDVHKHRAGVREVKHADAEPVRGVRACGIEIDGRLAEEAERAHGEGAEAGVAWGDLVGGAVGDGQGVDRAGAGDRALDEIDGGAQGDAAAVGEGGGGAVDAYRGRGVQRAYASQRERARADGGRAGVGAGAGERHHAVADLGQAVGAGGISQHGAHGQVGRRRAIGDVEGHGLVRAAVAVAQLDELGVDDG